MADEELRNLAMAALQMETGEDQPPPKPLKPVVQKCHQLLHRRMKVGVLDGRFFMGKFHCLDKQGNIILYDTIECRETHGTRNASDATPLSTMEQRSLGLVLIPARCRTCCLVEGSIHEQLSLLSVEEK